MTERQRSAQLNVAALRKRIARATLTLEAEQAALGEALAEADAADTEAALLPPEPPQAPPGVAPGRGTGAAHHPTVLTQDYTS